MQEYWDDSNSTWEQVGAEFDKFLSTIGFGVI